VSDRKPLDVDGVEFEFACYWAKPHHFHVRVWLGGECVGETKALEGVENTTQAARYIARKWLAREARDE